ncbi:unnamed protein product, partial [Didymodactylos carnosus]
SQTIASDDSTNISKPMKPFNTREVKDLLEHIVQETMDKQQIYEPEKCTQLSKDLSQIVKNAMKSLNYERYKYVTQVVIGECKDENMMMTCRCLWDLETDNYASYVYSNSDVFCAVTVFGLFYY